MILRTKHLRLPTDGIYNETDNVVNALFEIIIPSNTQNITSKDKPTRSLHPAAKFTTEKKDSSHLTLPDTKAAEEGKKWQRFLAPPSLFSKDKVAETIRSVRKEAVSSPTYVGSVLPYGYGCVRKQEKVVFPDGTVYSLTASWVADPTLTMLHEAGVQTSPEKEEEERVEVSDKEYVDKSDLFLAQSTTKEDTKPNICVLEETIIDLTMSDEEDYGSDTSSETDTAAESDESHVETVRVVIECEDSDI
ncbi:unnamed protein product [Mytilus edulis]|uniref:Uncharacterized protein n=1 Tax=Mytilus edulis TaxID=6550 RepID=A0A8S3VIC4_MYTED|nr:unnamed protein product [Mytilus edulis]